MNDQDSLLILDFGSQYTQLIARRIRELHVYCEIHPFDIPVDEIRKMNPKGIIMSGGPQSVFGDEAPHCSREILEMGIPILGVCYGMQLTAYLLDGEVEPASHREYGAATIETTSSPLFEGTSKSQRVWMSHGDRIARSPSNFSTIASSANAPLAAFANQDDRIYGIQFHPEVSHTPEGRKILENFAYRICGCRGEWSIESFRDRKIEEIREKVGSSRVIAAVSGGVDSSVAAVLVGRAIGEQLTAIFVDNGVLRKDESLQVMSTLSDGLGLHVVAVDARERFLSKLAGVTDPELKRRIIGHEFIGVFEDEAKRIEGVEYLVQGTLYPDVIESVSVRGPSAVIKTHHNVGGLPDTMGLDLVEPLRELFKDEVRALGIELGLDHDFVWRHPFPGPGLAVRILGEVTAERVAVLQQADAIFIEEIRRAGLYDAISQALAVLLPVRSVGVMGDERTYENVCALRAVTTTDFMTADWFRFPPDTLDQTARRIVNEVKGINRVVYDVSSKPPSTIEWE